ncbi:MAG: LemA family protein [Acidimicrobiales bacterium]
MIVVWVLLALALLIGLAVLVGYNRFVRQRTLIDNSWSNVDTELQRRYDLIPNLVETVKGYAAHERSTLESVTAARDQAVASTGSPEQQAATENALVGSLRTLFAVSEAYPDLKADASFADLQRQLTATEDRIQAARRFYNNNVRDYNTRVQTVPSNLIARLAGFEPREFFQIDAAVEQSAPQVDLSAPPEPDQA